MYKESFPSKLKQARETTGYTQQQIADMLNIKQYQISCYDPLRRVPAKPAVLRGNFTNADFSLGDNDEN